MKKRSKRLLALLLPTLVISLLPVNTTSAQPGDADTVVMTVNDDKITKGDIWRRTRLMFGAELAKVEGEEKKDLEKQLVPRIQEELIARSLLLREANKNKIEITNDELNEALNRIKQTAPEAADFGKFLEQMHLDEEGYRKGLRTEMKITKLVAKMTEALEPPSDEEVRKFYDDNPKMFEQGESAKA
ncbi:MAG: SurA N-terminal domain-containing protein, partial [Verrucomicrobiota bacterium]